MKHISISKRLTALALVLTLAVPTAVTLTPATATPVKVAVSSSSQSARGSASAGTIQLNIKDANDLSAKLSKTSYKRYTTTFTDIYDTFSEYGTNTTIAIMASVKSLSSVKPGTVEYAFASKKAFGFKLPSGGKQIKTIADIEYLMNWDTTSQSLDKKTKVRKGSCGVGMLGWSYDRRKDLCGMYLQYMTTDADVTPENLMKAEIAFMRSELDTIYSSTLASMKSQKTASNAAAKFITGYVKPTKTSTVASKASKEALNIQKALSKVK